MGIYGAYAEQMRESVSVDFDLNEALLEIYSDIVESYESEESDEIVEEGANLDIRAIWKDAKKDSKAHIKEYKKFLKAEDYKSAAKELDYVSKNLKKAREEIKKVDADSVGSAILGYFAIGFLNIVEQLVPSTIKIAGVSISIATALSKAGSSDGIFKLILLQLAMNNQGGIPVVPGKMVVGPMITKFGHTLQVINSIIIVIKDIKTFIKEANSDKELTVKNFNLYRNRLLRYLDDSIKLIDKYKDNLSKLEKIKKEDLKEK